MLNRACFDAPIDALIAVSYLTCSPSLDGLPGCRLFHRRLCRWPSVRRSPAPSSSSASLLWALVRRGQLQPHCFLARGGRYPGQMKMSMSRADEDVNVDMYLFYLSSVLRMVSVDTQRVETGPVKCNSITKRPWASPVPQVDWHLGRSCCFR